MLRVSRKGVQASDEPRRVTTGSCAAHGQYKIVEAFDRGQWRVVREVWWPLHKGTQTDVGSEPREDPVHPSPLPRAKVAHDPRKTA